MALNIICIVFIFFFRDLSYRHIGLPSPVSTSTVVTLFVFHFNYLKLFSWLSSVSFLQSPLVISCFYFCPFVFK